MHSLVVELNIENQGDEGPNPTSTRARSFSIFSPSMPLPALFTAFIVVPTSKSPCSQKKHSKVSFMLPSYIVDGCLVGPSKSVSSQGLFGQPGFDQELFNLIKGYINQRNNPTRNLSRLLFWGNQTGPQLFLSANRAVQPFSDYTNYVLYINWVLLWFFGQTVVFSGSNNYAAAPHATTVIFQHDCNL